MKTQKITANWPIKKIIEEYPEATTVLTKYGFPCVGCAMSHFENLAQGAMITHGMDDSFLEQILGELNEIASKTKVAPLKKKHKYKNLP